MRESTVEDHLVKVVKHLGGIVRKVKWIGQRSAPDRVAMFPAHLVWPASTPCAETIWVELKRPGKDAEEAQAREHKRMREHGQVVVVLNTIEEINTYFNVTL